VWLCNEQGQRCFNLGPKQAVAKKPCKWLSIIDMRSATEKSPAWDYQARLQPPPRRW
jgi:hypothetical protein